MKTFRILFIATLATMLAWRVGFAAAAESATDWGNQVQPAPLPAVAGPPPVAYGDLQPAMSWPTAPVYAPTTAPVQPQFVQPADDTHAPWTIDYRVRATVDSHTTYEFGFPGGWSPLSRLKFPINSLWHGLDVGLREKDWGIHFQWLMPLQRQIDGDMYDYDWMMPDQGFTDLGVTQQRWTDGQMLDLGAEFRAFDSLYGWPIELWPTLGFRWQRFDIMAYNLVQWKEDDVWPADPYRYAGDVISFNQEYYIYYIGGQLRTKLGSRVSLTFQGDWGYTFGRNIDHHLLREGDRFTFEQTEGDSWHIGLTTEVALTRRWSLGFEVEHTRISTTGKHRMLNQPLDIDESWTDGVRVWSDQTWLTAFVRFRT